MDNLIDELATIERRCARGAALFSAAPISDSVQAITKAAAEVGISASGSWAGYHSRIYYGEFQRPARGDRFSTEWGFKRAMSNPTTGDWRERQYDEVTSEVMKRAGTPDLKELDRAVRDAKQLFDECQQELLASFDAVLAETKDNRLQQLRDSATKLAAYLSQDEIAQSKKPRQAVSRDSEAIYQGVQVPPHVAMECLAMSVASSGESLQQLAAVAKQARLYLEKRMQMKGTGIGRTEGKVFIGHGRSPAWKDLKTLLQDRLHLTPDEFNLVSAAGMTTIERIEEMLDSAVFAFLVLTAEDERADGTTHARENVAHEAGLFQGRLGFKRAIILLEEGCAEFSNIHGLVQIRFPSGNVKSASEEIRAVLEREGLLRT